LIKLQKINGSVLKIVYRYCKDDNQLQGAPKRIYLMITEDRTWITKQRSRAKQKSIYKEREITKEYTKSQTVQKGLVMKTVFGSGKASQQNSIEKCSEVTQILWG